MFNTKDVIKRFPDFNPFTPSDWNESNELPMGVYELIDIAYKNDTVFTEYNFMLCFNLQDKETNSSNGNYVMFIPDPKFNII